MNNRPIIFREIPIGQSFKYQFGMTVLKKVDDTTAIASDGHRYCPDWFRPCISSWYEQDEWKRQNGKA